MVAAALANFALRPEHGWCLFSMLTIFPANIFGIYQVVRARKLYDVKYPTLYLERGHKHANDFNCVQRAHQNVLENIPLHLFFSMTSSVLRPEIAFAAILLRTIGFVVYMQYYATGVPAKRQYGAFGYIGHFVMIGLTIELAWRQTFSSL